MPTTQTITLQETGAPSRSKGRGWARIGSGDNATFATAGGRSVSVDGPFDVVLGVELRRATRGPVTERATYTLEPAEGESVELTIGSPQSYDVRIDGARLV